MPFAMWSINTTTFPLINITIQLQNSVVIWVSAAGRFANWCFSLIHCKTYNWLVHNQNLWLGCDVYVPLRKRRHCLRFSSFPIISYICIWSLMIASVLRRSRHILNNSSYFKQLLKIFAIISVRNKCCHVYVPVKSSFTWLDSHSNQRNKAIQEWELDKGIIDPTGMETFSKEPKFAKFLRELKSTLVRVSLKQSTGFSRMSVTVSLLCFGCFAAK